MLNRIHEEFKKHLLAAEIASAAGIAISTWKHHIFYSRDINLSKGMSRGRLPFIAYFIGSDTSIDEISTDTSETIFQATVNIFLCRNELENTDKATRIFRSFLRELKQNNRTWNLSVVSNSIETIPWGDKYTYTISIDFDVPHEDFNEEER
jgi:hypothetical protein